MHQSSELSETTPLHGNVHHKVAQLEQSSARHNTSTTATNERFMHKRIILWVILITRICFILVILFSLLDLLIYLLKDISSSSSSGGGVANNNNNKESGANNKIPLTSSPYTKVQTLSFQIYTGGAPAFIIEDEGTGEEKKNYECHGCKCFAASRHQMLLFFYICYDKTSSHCLSNSLHIL